MNASVQANEVSYELESLGWKSFQDLCATVVGEVLGQTIQVFATSRDGGRDGAFHGYWNPSGKEDLTGTFTVQCKYTSRRDHPLSPADLADELAKATRLAARGLSDNYILITNYRISGSTEEVVRSSFVAIPGIEHCLVFGSEWVTRVIRESPRLRMLVPRVYGIGDLSQILEQRSLDQAVAILNSMSDDLAKFVITDAYRSSASALLEHGFVLLLGEPASGKTTIAASLAVGAIDVWKCSTLKVRDADELVAHWNPHEPRQFFWVDDAFGITQYQRSAINSWNRAFPAVQAAINRGARILLTSRDYIFKAALNDLKLAAFPLLTESQVIINVQALSLSEKEQILYNHLKLGTQSLEFRSQIKPYLPSVAANPQFVPEIARRLGNRAFTRSLTLETTSITRFVEQPVAFLLDVVRSLDLESKAALALIFMNDGALESPATFTPSTADVLELLGGTPSGIRRALNAMIGSLVKLVVSDKGSFWRFRHPTIGEAFQHILAEDPEAMDIYLKGAPIQGLLGSITCGVTDLQGVKVVVPASRFEIVRARLETVNTRDAVDYLAARCNQDFLSLYLASHPKIYEFITHPSPYLSSVGEVALVMRLNELGMLTEEVRAAFVEGVRELAVDIPDSDFLTVSRIRAFFRASELSSIMQSVRQELLPNLSKCLDNWRFNYGRGDDPDEYYQPLVESLEAYRQEFQGDAEAAQRIQAALEETYQSIDELRDNYSPEAERYGQKLPPSDPIQSSTDRSIFDDVDE